MQKKKTSRKPLTCLCSCYNTYKFLMGESQTEHFIGKKWSIKVEHVIGKQKHNAPKSSYSSL